MSVYHETAYFRWTDCPKCGKRMVVAKARGYTLTIPDAHTIHDVTSVIFYPERYFDYEAGCVPASWHIIPAWPAGGR